MRWQAGRRSDNVEDRRGMSAGAGRGLKIGGGLSLVVVVVGMLLGKDFRPLAELLSALGAGSPEGANEPASTSSQKRSPAEDQLADFVSVVLADTEDTWTELFKKMNQAYVRPKLVLFSDAVNSACGYNTAAVGPFYCPPDQKVYIDLSFYAELKQKLGAPGDFAQAYVIAHEIGHHVQKLLGISERLRAQERTASKVERNQLSVRQELQADCFAGVWGHYAEKQRKLLEQGDLEEAIGAAAAIGDDRLQKRAGRAVTPETWSHGSSKQRVRWFQIGMKQGRVEACDTYGAQPLE
jgi:predicted metalloprotease